MEKPKGHALEELFTQKKTDRSDELNICASK